MGKMIDRITIFGISYQIHKPCVDVGRSRSLNKIIIIIMEEYRVIIKKKNVNTTSNLPPTGRANFEFTV